MSSKKKLILVGIILIIVIGLVYLFIINRPKPKKKLEEQPIVVTNEIIHSEMGTFRELTGRIDYQYGNFKLVIEPDKSNDKILVKYNDSIIIETKYNGGAKVRVNMYNNLYLLEVDYTMAQCKTLKLFSIDSNGKFIEEVRKDNKISEINYYSDVNKIIIYEDKCEMDCTDCTTKYTYEIVDGKFKQISSDLKDPADFVTLVEKDEDYEYYAFNTSDTLINKDDEYTFKIGEYTIKYILKEEPKDSLKNYEMYVNDKKIYDGIIVDENTIQPYIKIKKLGKYLLFTNTFYTSTRSIILYVYDGTSLREIRELDEVKGMAIKNSIIINKEGILIRGTRLDNGPVIRYDGKSYDIYSKETCENTMKELKDNFVVEQDYSYRYINSNLSFLPVKSNKYILKDFVKKEETCSNMIK